MELDWKRCVLKYNKIIFVFLLCGLVSSLVRAEDLEPCGGAILISREIKPYIQMVNAVEENLDIPLCRVFFDTKGQIYSLDSHFSGLNRHEWDFIVAAGPDALSHLVKEQVRVPVFYGMVLNPEQIISGSGMFCGVTLNLFTPERIRTFKQILPKLNRLAVLYNPDSNLIYPEIVNGIKQVEGVTAVPVEVLSEEDIPAALKRVVKEADAIYFIPDRTVSSPAIVKFIIKYGISHSIPSLGYNRFFHESGAVLSFSIDYTVIGRQVSDMITRFKRSAECTSKDPEADLLFNEKVTDFLKMEVNKQFLNQ